MATRSKAQTKAHVAANTAHGEAVDARVRKDKTRIQLRAEKIRDLGYDPMRRRTQAEIRSMIPAQDLMKRLRDHTDGKCELSVTQVRAATYLLDKVISNAPTEISVEDGALGSLAEQLEAAKARAAEARARREGS